MIKEILEKHNCYSLNLELELLRHFEKLRNEMLFQAGTEAEIKTATLEKLQQTIDLAFPPLYYVLDRNLDCGKFYYCKETDLNPEFIVCHPDDFDAVKNIITTKRLVLIKDEPLDFRRYYGHKTGCREKENA